MHRRRTFIALALVSCMLLSGCVSEPGDETPADVLGCIDESASNYDIAATTDDGSCEYPDSDGDGVFDMDEIVGCMSAEATNYDPEATDEAPCVFPPWESSYGVNWVRHDPGGDCQCSDGSNYSFWTRHADPSRVVLYFQGGGGCWNDYSCQFEGGTYKTTVGEWDNPSTASSVYSNNGGIFNFNNEDNPFADWSFVFVPYCTGDIHIGATVTEYEGGPVSHNGHVNSQTAYAHMLETYPLATQIFVTGSSAGSPPSPFYGALASDDYPEASIAVFNDGSGGLFSNNTYDFYEIWGLNSSMADFPVDGLNFNEMTSADLILRAWAHDNDIRFARFDDSYDNTMRYFNALLENDVTLDYKSVIISADSQIEEAGMPYSGYLSPGQAHTILTSERFYTLEVEGQPFLEWFTSFVEGGQPESVYCVQCG
ncbi:MAG: pectin acetylesterase-family hydrolase [Candidatus Thalassarchaeaceae archaeon]|nr:pectin acetylesterase-family hydrolase [Candidatus Thalassarchaeaceae archaeon]MDP6703401.1 pectin acetylesterase-family hydrolase [Candidatus Thalassarchaeaceae archaeon]MDP7003452.1 pectin acetylesterase-family hydrolase [Candidatus Thalassarchaeaceae archaeon]